MMTFDELMRKVLTLFPDAELGEDNDGQIVIYTDLEEGPKGIRKFAPPPDYTCAGCDPDVPDPDIDYCDRCDNEDSVEKSERLRNERKFTPPDKMLCVACETEVDEDGSCSGCSDD